VKTHVTRDFSTFTAVICTQMCQFSINLVHKMVKTIHGIISLWTPISQIGLCWVMSFNVVCFGRVRHVMCVGKGLQMGK